MWEVSRHYGGGAGTPVSERETAFLYRVMAHQPGSQRTFSRREIVRNASPRRYLGVPMIAALAAVFPFISSLGGTAIERYVAMTFPAAAIAVWLTASVLIYSKYYRAARAGQPATATLVTLDKVIDSDLERIPKWRDISMEGTLRVQDVAEPFEQEFEFYAPWGPDLEQGDIVDVALNVRRRDVLMILGPASGTTGRA